VSGIAVSFCTREDALVALGVVAHLGVAQKLAQRLLRYDDATLGQLRAVASKDTLIVLGPTKLLPWVDGVSYLGQDPSALLLLLPTAVRPELPIDAFEQAVIRKAGKKRPPIVVLDDPPLIISAAEAQPIARERLEAWIGDRA
jgi:hypothetical protein